MSTSRDCHRPYHPRESCQIAAERAAQWAALDAYVQQQIESLASLAGRTPMHLVPPALRGPNWKASTA